MTEKTNDEPGAPEIVEKSRKLSAVWFVPVVAAVIGGWLAIRHFAEAGVTIEITFESADGIEAGKTQIKYKEIQVGVVDSVDFSPDASRVIVQATMNPDAKPHLRAGSEYWVVQPRLGPGGITGLGTIVSGAYINVRLGTGKPTRKFIGLEDPPANPDNVKGLRVVLKTDELGSLTPGVPVLFRGLRVGEIEKHRLLKDGSGIEVDVFVEAPNDRFLKTSSRFWNASGIEASFGANGLDVRSGSLGSILVGGVAFDSPVGHGSPAKNGDTYRLFESFHVASKTPHVERGPYYVLYPEGSIRGLHVGAPVTLEGVVIGGVTEVTMEYDSSFGIRTPVQIRLEPERVAGVHPDDADEIRRMMNDLVERGLRAQMKSGNILTGELLVALDFHPDTPARLIGGTKLPELPTIPATLASFEAKAGQFLDHMVELQAKAGTFVDHLVDLEHKAGQFVDHLAALPLDELATDAQATARDLRALLRSVNEQVGPLAAKVEGLTDDARGTLSAATRAIGTVEAGFAPDSTMYYDLATTLEELSEAARSLRVLAGYLERHPNALIMGKSKSGGEK